MPKLIPPGFIDVSVKVQRTGDPDLYITTFGARILTPPFTQANTQSMAGLIQQSFDGVTGTGEILKGVTVRVGQDGDPLVMEGPLNTVGLSSGTRTPPNTAVIVSKLSALGGRRNRGRMFWPSISEGTVDDLGLITTATLNAYQTEFNNFLIGLRGGGGFAQNTDEMVILHSTNPLSPAPTPPPTIVTALRVEQLVGTQRRRLRR